MKLDINGSIYHVVYLHILHFYFTGGIKGAWPDQKNCFPLYSMKIEILISEESSYFSDYHSEILCPKYVSFGYCELKRWLNFYKSVVITSKVQTVFYEAAKQYSFLQLVWKPLEPFHSKFGIKIVCTMDLDVRLKTRHEKLWTCTFNEKGAAHCFMCPIGKKQKVSLHYLVYHFVAIFTTVYNC